MDLSDGQWPWDHMKARLSSDAGDRMIWKCLEVRNKNPNERLNSTPAGWFPVIKTG